MRIFFWQVFHLKQNFRIFFLIFTQNPSPTPKIGMVSQKLGTWKFLLNLKKKIIFSASAPPRIFFSIFFLNIYPKSFPDTKIRNGFLTCFMFYGRSTPRSWRRPSFTKASKWNSLSLSSSSCRRLFKVILNMPQISGK